MVRTDVKGVGLVLERLELTTSCSDLDTILNTETTLDTVGNDAKDTKDENKGSIVTAWNSDER